MSGSTNDKQYAVLARYPHENCVTTPHLCPDGFTLAFYAKMDVTPQVNRVFTNALQFKDANIANVVCL